MMELSVYRNEDKYLISYIQAMSLKEKLDCFLKKDAHSGTGGYVVRSLYFDSIDGRDFFSKIDGNEQRKKIRLRLYNPADSVCKLELKQKNGDLQHKVSVLLDREEARQIISGNMGVLRSHFGHSETALRLYAVMKQGCYRPAALIEYDRFAYTFPQFNTRLTLDMHVRSKEGDMDLFSASPRYVPILNDMVILEVKYNEKLMGFISDILRPYHLTKTSVSKYCWGRKVFYELTY